MSFFFCCINCSQGWQVVGELVEVKSILDTLRFERGSMPCFTPDCTGHFMETTGPAQGFVTKEIPVRAFYRAIHGFGTGEGAPASVKDFVHLLKTKKVVSVEALPVGQPERVIVRQIVLEGDVRLHFDSSSRGACCFYIERAGKSCVEVVEDELRRADHPAQDADGLADSDREEAGRAPAPGQPEADEGGEGLRPSPAPDQPGAVPVSVVQAGAQVSEGDGPVG